MKTKRYIAVIDLEVYAANENEALIKSEEAAYNIGGEVTDLIYQPEGTTIAVNCNIEKLRGNE